MAAATINPILIASAPTSFADLTTGPLSQTEWSVNVRVANTTANIIYYRLYLTVSADNAQTSGTYRVYDYAVTPNDSLDVEMNLVFTSGYKLRHQASATGLAVSLTGRLRAV